jgi:glycosyltransferase involved in cell wall biosynthesis
MLARPGGDGRGPPTRKSFKFLQTSFPWVADKGFDLTVKAFCSAFSSRDDVALVLRVPTVADATFRERTFGELRKLVDAEASRPGAPEILLLEENIEPNRRAAHYLGANCYVHPARAEGFGMTILEAMACGLPVISTPWSGPADFLSPLWAYTLRHSAPVAERSHDGSVLRYFVTPELDHLVALMRHVYQHQDEARALGREGARVARQRWTWQHAARKLASLFSLDADVPAFGGNQEGRI